MKYQEKKDVFSINYGEKGGFSLVDWSTNPFPFHPLPSFRLTQLLHSYLYPPKRRGRVERNTRHGIA